ncbi:MAG: hypothetical protein ABR552_11295 [Actinomycetota bacterium]|nr:hypothetical protein [Actinomycetota bacterium]
MSNPPQFRIVKGSPTPEEQAAIAAAVLQLWRAEHALAAAARGADPWRVAARIEAAGRGRESIPRTARAWKTSGRVAAQPVSHLQPGRGDAR